MTGYDQKLEGYKPEIRRLRQGGSTPQEICTKLAHDIFNDRNRYNAVKGWYQRTFDDWPSEGTKARYKEHRPLQSGASHQLPAGLLPKKPPACFPPQQQQSFPSQEPNYASQQASSANPYSPYYSSLAIREVSSPHGTAIFQPVHQNRHYPLDHDCPGITSPAPNSVYQLNDAQSRPSGLDPQLSLGQYGSRPQQHGPRHKSNGGASQLSIGAIGPPHQQARPPLQQNGYLQHARIQVNEGEYLIGHTVLQESSGVLGRDLNQMNSTTDENTMTWEQFLHSDSLYPNPSVGPGHFGGGPNLSPDGQQFILQSSAPPKQSLLAYDGQRYHHSQASNTQNTSPVAAGLFATSPGNDQTQILPNQEYQSNSLAGQHRPTRASNKHCRSVSILSDPTPPPQYPLPADPPADPPAKFTVLHRGFDGGSKGGPWRPFRVQGGSMVTVDPDRLPTDHPPKRVKGVGTKSHDSMVIHPEHLKAPHLVATGTPAPYADQAIAARVPLSHRPVNSSNVSFRSSFRDSGYVSVLDSTIVESMQPYFDALKLTDAECKTDYEESDDGFVDVKITTKGRMRRSYIEKMHPPIYG